MENFIVFYKQDNSIFFIFTIYLGILSESKSVIF